MKATRIVFEKGIELCRTDDRPWFLELGSGKIKNLTPSSISKKYGVRPVLEALFLSPGNEIISLLPAKPMRRLYVELSEIQAKASTKDVSFLHFQNLLYGLGALNYHCIQLAGTYCKIIRSATRFPIDKPNRWIFGNQPEPYYEFDALITVARRTYNALGHIIWNLFGSKKGGAPDNFERTIQLCEKKCPTTLKNRLKLSCSQFGSKVKDYRDCIQHYNPIVNWSPYAIMEQGEGGILSASILIPDNPEAKSPKRFRYDSRLDALTYGWELTTEIFKVAWAIINELPDKEVQQKGGETQK